MAELKTNTPHAPPACLDLGTIEAIASERRADPKEQSHLDSCEVCRTALDEFLANVRLLVRMRRVMGSGFGAEPKSALPEDLVPGYRILEEISRGAQGVVYKAVQERTKRVVALKMLLQGTFATEKQRRRFEREVEIAAALKHPGIVTVYDGTPVRGGRYAYAIGRVAAAGEERPRAARVDHPAVHPDMRGGAVRAQQRGNAPRPQAGQHHR
jgi:serine/threonine protein kinase